MESTNPETGVTDEPYPSYKDLQTKKMPETEDRKLRTGI